MPFKESGLDYSTIIFRSFVILFISLVAIKLAFCALNFRREAVARRARPTIHIVRLRRRNVPSNGNDSSQGNATKSLDQGQSVQIKNDSAVNGESTAERREGDSKNTI